MPKERRWCLRKKAAFDVDIITNDHAEYQHCKASNMGIEGIFVELNPDHIKKNARVQVKFNLPKDLDLHQQTIRAIVVHRNHRGIGLVFRDHNLDTIRFMRELFYTHNKRS